MADKLKEVVAGVRVNYGTGTVPSLLEIMRGTNWWKEVYDAAAGDVRGLMTESVVDHFHAHSVEAVQRLDHAGYTPDQISMETGLMPAKIDVIFEAIGSDKRVETPSDTMGEPPWPVENRKLPACHLWEVNHSYYGEAQYNEMDFATWEDFLESMGNADNDYNYLIRWDWNERDRELDMITYKGDDNERTGHVKLIYHAQRKGFTMSAYVKVCRNDEPKVRKYLEEKWVYMENMWAPISNGTSERVPDEELSPRTPAQMMENLYNEIMHGEDSDEYKRIVKEAMGDFDPKAVNWVKYIFKVNYKNLEPVVFPPAGPFWHDRMNQAEGTYTVTAYLPEGVSVHHYWPSATMAEEPRLVDRIVYEVNPNYWETRESTKPQWWPF